jgi:hypothetical protein
MANSDIISRMSAVLDEYEAGRIRPEEVERSIRFNIEAIEALPYARIKEADALCHRLVTSHMLIGDEEFISVEDVAQVLADFRKFLASLSPGGAGELFVRWESADRIIHDTDDGIEVVVNGDATRRKLAQRIVDGLTSIADRATRLLVSFMRDSGTFELGSVEVFPRKLDDGGDFSLRFAFTADRDPREYGYTYFDVYFSHSEPPQPEFWPYKFTVGFH